MRRTSRKLLENETTDEHSAAQPQPKLWSTVFFGVRQLAAAFVRVELLRLRKGASKLAHSKKDALWKNPCQISAQYYELIRKCQSSGNAFFSPQRHQDTKIHTYENLADLCVFVSLW